MSNNDTNIERSSGNVFAELGLPDAETQLLGRDIEIKICEPDDHREGRLTLSE